MGHDIDRCVTCKPYKAHPTATPSSPGPGGTKVFSNPNSLEMRPFNTLCRGEEEGKRRSGEERVERGNEEEGKRK